MSSGSSKTQDFKLSPMRWIVILATLGFGAFAVYQNTTEKHADVPNSMNDAELGLSKSVKQRPEVPSTPPSGSVSTPDAPSLPAGKLEDIDFNAYSQGLAGPLGLVMGESRLDSIDKIRLYFAPEPGVNMVNMTSSTFERDDGSVMLFARNNLPDDSVFAQEVYAVFSGPGNTEKFNQTLASYGLRVKCRRGNTAMEWSTELCP